MYNFSKLINVLNTYAECSEKTFSIKYSIPINSEEMPSSCIDDAVMSYKSNAFYDVFSMKKKAFSICILKKRSVYVSVIACLGAVIDSDFIHRGSPMYDSVHPSILVFNIFKAFLESSRFKALLSPLTHISVFCYMPGNVYAIRCRHRGKNSFLTLRLIENHTIEIELA